MLGHRSCLLSPALMSSLLSCPGDGETACPRYLPSYPSAARTKVWRLLATHSPSCSVSPGTQHSLIHPSIPSSDTDTSVGREAGSAHAHHSIPSRSVSLACVRASSPAFLPDLQRLQGWKTEALSQAGECQVWGPETVVSTQASVLLWAVSRRQHTEE